MAQFGETKRLFRYFPSEEVFQRQKLAFDNTNTSYIAGDGTEVFGDPDVCWQDICFIEKETSYTSALDAESFIHQNYFYTHGQYFSCDGIKDSVTLAYSFAHNVHGLADAYDVASELVEVEDVLSSAITNHEGRLQAVEAITYVAGTGITITEIAPSIFSISGAQEITLPAYIGDTTYITIDADGENQYKASANIVSLDTAYANKTHGVADSLDVANELIAVEKATSAVLNDHEIRITNLEGESYETRFAADEANIATNTRNISDNATAIANLQAISYVAGDNIEINQNGSEFTINCTAEDTQYTAGQNINISTANVIKAKGYVYNDTTKSFKIDGAANTVSGNYSFASGSSNKATANNATAMGGSNTASGQYSVAMGGANTASVLYATAFGWKNLSSGQASFVEGQSNISSGRSSHAEGNANAASAQGAHAEGLITIADAIAAHSEGSDTHAHGVYSHTEGQYTYAYGNASHAEGFGSLGRVVITGGKITSTSGAQPVIEITTTTDISSAKRLDIWFGGNTTQWCDFYLHVETVSVSDTTYTITCSSAYPINFTSAQATLEQVNVRYGIMNIASGMASHTEGLGTQALGNYQHVQGMYNVPDNANAYAMIIGNGTSRTSLHNAFTVDWSGNVANSGYTYTKGVVAPDAANRSSAKCFATDGSIQNIGEGGAATLYEETTYTALVAKIDNNTLVPGQQYCITDYTMVLDEQTLALGIVRSAGHHFSIIVVADSNNTLNENARAILSETTLAEDDYFLDEDLESWKLKYDINNDTTKYEWADATNGKGVIYYMKDQFGNEAYYDFKNLQYKRVAITGVAGGVYPADFVTTVLGDTFAGLNIYTLDTKTFNWYYTFSTIDNNGTVYDNSLCNSPASPENAIHNIIKPYFDNSDSTVKLLLNSIVFCSDKSAGQTIYCNYVDCNCYNITVLEGTYYNHFESEVNSIYLRGNKNKFGYQTSVCAISGDNNIIGDYCGAIYIQSSDNEIKDNCNDICIDGSCEFNTIGNKCNKIEIGKMNKYNKFGDYCREITLGQHNSYNVFDSGCTVITLGGSCVNNTFGTSCNRIIYGDECSYNVVENGCNRINIGLNSVRCHFGPGCAAIYFGPDPDTIIPQYQNITVLGGNAGIMLIAAEGGVDIFRNVILGAGVNNDSGNPIQVVVSGVNQDYETRVISHASQTILI